MRKIVMMILTLFAVIGSVSGRNLLYVHLRTQGDSRTLKQVMDQYGGYAYQVDSLIVDGYLYQEDFPVMSRYCQTGALRGINLEDAHFSLYEKVPAYAFCPDMVNGEIGAYRSQLEYITLPRATETIEEMAFAYTNLKSFAFSRIVRHLSTNIFEGCDQLRNVVLHQNEPLPQLARVLSDLPADAKVYIPAGTKSLFLQSDAWKAVPNLVESEEAFRVRVVNTDEGDIKTVLERDSNRVDSLVVCGSLTTKDLRALNDYMYDRSVSGVNLSGCEIEDRAIHYTAFYGLRPLCYASLPDNIVRIYSRAFLGTRLRQIVLPDSLKELGNEVYNGCKNVTGDIRIPEGTRKIGTSCFVTCYQVRNMYVPSTLDSLSECALNISLVKSGKPVCNLYVNRMTPPTFYTEEEDGNPLMGGPLAYFDYEEWTLSGWKLYVPVGAKKNFENAQYWCDIPEIIETPELTGGVTAVKAVRTVGDTGLTEVYTLGGRLVSKGLDLPRGLAKGLYVVKTGGKTQKMLINE